MFGYNGKKDGIEDTELIKTIFKFLGVDTKLKDVTILENWDSMIALAINKDNMLIKIEPDSKAWHHIKSLIHLYHDCIFHGKRYSHDLHNQYYLDCIDNSMYIV